MVDLYRRKCCYRHNILVLNLIRSLHGQESNSLFLDFFSSFITHISYLTASYNEIKTLVYTFEASTDNKKFPEMHINFGKCIKILK